MTNLFSWQRGGMPGIFLWFIDVFNNDQNVFELELGYTSLTEKYG